MNEKIREKLSTLPDSPGSYQMLDKSGKIIYVGKAKNLKNRVRSYFIGAHNDKTTALVSNIDDINYIECENEKEAFLLEISLIKEHRPFYNILLMDDKTYPYIEYTKELNPRFVISRKLTKNNTRYFGPYINVTAAKKVLELINSLYKIRRCNTIPKKACIYYEINECSAPCINTHTKEYYENIYKSVRGLLNGTDNSVIQELKKEMAESSEKLNFENANRCKNLINSIKEMIVKQDVLLKDKIDADFYGVSYDDDSISISTIIVRNGKILLSKSDLLSYYLDLNDALYTYILNQYMILSDVKTIYIDKDYKNDLDYLLDDFNVIYPIKGAKHNLLKIANENATTQLNNKTKIKVDKNKIALKELSELINIDIPTNIESFDNSNLFGDNPVSSLIVYTNGKKNKKEYRKYKVKTVEGANDFETMKEVCYRRYKRLKDENKKLPNLILLDGGEIQVKACKEVLLSLDLSIDVAGLKKDINHETNTLIYNNMEYKLNKHSELYRFLFEIQEEVHRFAITFHRNLKEKSLFDSILDNIELIGDSTKNKLLNKYKTIENIYNASSAELKELGLNNKQIENIKNGLKDEFE